MLWRLHLNSEVAGHLHNLNVALAEAGRFARIGSSTPHLMAGLTWEPGELIIEWRGPESRPDRTDQIPYEQDELEKFADFCRLSATFAMIVALEEFVAQLCLDARVAGPALTSPLDFEQFQEILEEFQEFVRKYGFSAALDEVARAAGHQRGSTNEGPDHVRRLAALPALRNCIAHRMGPVSEVFDIREGGQLVVPYRELFLTVDGHPLTQRGHPVEAGSVLAIETREARQSWQAGDRVAFTLRDVNNMAAGMFLDAKQLACEVLNAFATRGGSKSSAGDE